jgi:hypothetical protein
VEATLYKLGSKFSPRKGSLTRLPVQGNNFILDLLDGQHEYVTTTITRVLRDINSNVIFMTTANSRYRLVLHGKN